MDLDRRRFLQTAAASLVSFPALPRALAQMEPEQLQQALAELRMFREGYPYTFMFWTVARDLLDEEGGLRLTPASPRSRG
jgi:hypothetical protein